MPQSPTVLNITWQPPTAEHQNGIIRSYVLNVVVMEAGSSDELTTHETALSVEGLHPFYTYTLYIAAVTIGEGPFSQAVNVQMPQSGTFVYCK